MKFKAIVIIAACSLLITGCGKKSDDTTQNDTPQPVASKTSQKEMLQHASAGYIKTFAGKLKGELMAAVSDGGMANAITVCQSSAPQLADEMSTNNWSIKRVSDKNRNSHNAADEHQLEIMSQFSDSLNNLAFIDEYVTIDSITSYYYYQPIKTSALCLKCHGVSDQIDSKVKMILRDKYPNDLAVEYKAGDLRGLFVVQAILPEGLNYAQELAGDSL